MNWLRRLFPPKTVTNPIVLSLPSTSTEDRQQEVNEKNKWDMEVKELKERAHYLLVAAAVQRRKGIP